MQRDKNLYSRKVMPPLPYGVGAYSCYASGPSFLNTAVAGPTHRGPYNGVELQASEICPQNFFIFDETDNRSRIMFHPALANKFNYPYIETHVENGIINRNDNEVLSLKEDSKDIDALLSLEEEDDECEEVSTGRTMGHFGSGSGSNSPDSYSTGSSRPSKKRLPSNQKSFPCTSSSNNNNGERKRQRMKKMLNALRGIVPGANDMDTVTVLDEAVRYLKSLKVEVKKLGIGSFNN